jgi:hypothetical protein
MERSAICWARPTPTAGPWEELVGEIAPWPLAAVGAVGRGTGQLVDPRRMDADIVAGPVAGLAAGGPGR